MMFFFYCILSCLFCYWHAIDFSSSLDIHQYSETFCKAIGPIPLWLILNDASPIRFNNIGVAELCPLGGASRCEIWWWKFNLIISEKHKIENCCKVYIVHCTHFRCYSSKPTRLQYQSGTSVLRRSPRQKLDRSTRWTTWGKRKKSSNAAPRWRWLLLEVRLCHACSKFSSDHRTRTSYTICGGPSKKLQWDSQRCSCLFLWPF